ncbi:MAG: hypothetical protein ACRD1K_06845 [Acidimicrobiales bacterium]
MGWYIEFGMQFRLDRSDVPRDPLPGDLPPDLQPSRTLAEMNARLRELALEKCAGGDVEAIEEEREAISEEKLLLPTEVGVKPLLFGEPTRSSDFWWTTAGILFGIALLAAVSAFRVRHRRVRLRQVRDCGSVDGSVVHHRRCIRDRRARRARQPLLRQEGARRAAGLHRGQEGAGAGMPCRSRATPRRPRC